MPNNAPLFGRICIDNAFTVNIVIELYTVGLLCEQHFYLEKYLSQFFWMLDLILQGLSTFINIKWKYQRGRKNKDASSKVDLISVQETNSTLYMRGGGGEERSVTKVA